MDTNALEISVCLCDRAVRIVEPKIYIVQALTKSELWQGRTSRMRILKTCPYHLCLRFQREVGQTECPMCLAVVLVYISAIRLQRSENICTCLEQSIGKRIAEWQHFCGSATCFYLLTFGFS